MQQQITAEQERYKQLEADSQRSDRDAIAQAQQLVAEVESRAAKSLSAKEELRAKLVTLRLIALHKRALAISQSVQGKEFVDMAEIDALMQADPPVADTELKSMLVAKILAYYHAQAEAAAAQCYAAARKL